MTPKKYDLDPLPEGKIWIWIGIRIFRPWNKDRVNSYPTREMTGQIGSTCGSHRSAHFF